jgi:NAD-dependent deacetylase
VLSDVRIADFHNVVFFTGAGMSAESGVPTYRGQGGIWKQYDYQSCACQTAFDCDPDYVWEFHNYRRGLVAGCVPNAGHHALARVERALESVTIVTQNIDGLHQRAGSERVFELHGSLWETRCDQCGARHPRVAEPLVETRCDCGAYKRPNIVWFGDTLFHDVVAGSIDAISRADLLVSIGTSAVVYPAADLPRVAKRAGSRLVEINLEDTPLSELYDIRVRASASCALVELCQGL